MLDNDTLTAYGTLAAVVVALGIAVAPLVWRQFTRPRLSVEFANRPPFRRRASREHGEIVSAYFRVRVVNHGWATAEDVTGRAVRFLDADGLENASMDPFMLNWSGGRKDHPGIDIRPGQSEYLDVLRVNSWPAHVGKTLGVSALKFDLLPHDESPRGFRFNEIAIKSQTLTISVVAKNSTGTGIELRLPNPDGLPTAVVQSVGLAHRPQGPFGLPTDSWQLTQIVHEVGDW
jgi:hypothetical protein